jgi:hypothetical protein
MADDRARLWAIHLNDHLASATGTVELARRAARENAGSERGAFLLTLARDLAADRAALRRAIQALGAEPDVLKVAGAWLGERLGRLKLNGRLREQSPLTPLVELEGLSLGITHNLLLWRLLRAHGPSVPLDLDALVTRAEGQRDAVERERDRAATALAAA